MDLSKTFPQLVISEESSVEEAIRQVSSLMKGLQMKVSDIETRMLSSTPQEVRDQREVEAKSAVTSMFEAVEQCEKLLGESAQIWSDLVEDAELQKVQAQIKALQIQHENLKRVMKTLSPLEKMHKDRDNRRLKQQLSGLKEFEEKLTEKLESLKNEAMKISQAIRTKFEGLKALVENMEMGTMELLSEQSVEKIKEKEGGVQQSVEEESVQYEQFLNYVVTTRMHV